MARGFRAALTDVGASFLDTYVGLLSHDVLVDRADPLRQQYVSWWADEASLVAYTGEAWASTPVTFPDEHRFLTGPLKIQSSSVCRLAATTSAPTGKTLTSRNCVTSRSRVC